MYGKGRLAAMMHRREAISAGRGRARTVTEARRRHINAATFRVTDEANQFSSDNEDAHYEYESAAAQVEPSDEPAFDEDASLLDDVREPAATEPLFDIDDMVYSMRSLERRMTTMEKNMLRLSTEVKTMFRTLVGQMATIAKGMQTHPPPAPTPPTSTPRDRPRPQPASTQPRPAPSEPQLADFAEYRKIKLRSSDDLEEFEQKLDDPKFHRNLAAYLDKRFSCETKSPKELFITIIRELTDTELFLPYTWKGSRRAGEVTPSFMGIHEKFVTFVRDHVVGRFDAISGDEVEKWFEKNVMRMKNENHSRQLERRASGRVMRKTCTRVHAPKAKRPRRADEMDGEPWDGAETESETMHGDEDVEVDPIFVCKVEEGDRESSGEMC